MKYRFIFKNGGWWLKISSVEELTEYDKKTALRNPIARGFLNSIHTEIFHTKGIEPTTAGDLIKLRAENSDMSLFQSACSFTIQSDSAKITQLMKGYSLYFNRDGGWHYGKNDYTQWCDRDKLIWPDFKIDQIKIEKFPNGEHFYAYIDSMQVRDGDTLKWNTYEEAYNQALQYVTDDA